MAHVDGEWRNKPQKNEKGEYDKYAWPGGYPLFYVTADNAVLCPDCANDPDNGVVVACEANYEDPDLYCEACNKKIEAAYTQKFRVKYNMDIIVEAVTREDAIKRADETIIEKYGHDGRWPDTIRYDDIEEEKEE